jgi:hypothetical protein
MMNPAIPSKVADVAACVSLGSCITGYIAEVTPILQALAFVAAVVSGTCATYYHIKMIRKLP